MLEWISSFFTNTTLTILLITFILCVVLTSEFWRNSRLPPGPYGLPWFGYTFWVKKDLITQQFAKLGEKYNTDILSFTILGNRFIVLNSYDLLKEVFQKRSDVADRGSMSVVFEAIDPGYSGIIGNNGQQWKDARKLSISSLKDFGMGRSGAEEMIQNEASILCEKIRKHNGEAFNPQTCMNIAVSNIICCLVFGQRFETTDPEFLNALEGMNKVAQQFTPVLMLLLQFRFTRGVIMRSKFQELSRSYHEFTNFTKKRIQEHKNNLDSQKTDLIYSFLREQEQDDRFTDRMLESSVSDLFIAGSETTYTTLRWCLLTMATYQLVQKKVQSELDHVIGDREPSMNDRKQTPYTDAVLSEIQRCNTLVPLGLGHSNNGSDINIKDYTIPKGSFIMANLNQIHHDKSFWKNPDAFDPENFLHEGKLVNLDRLIPFSIGRRACAGESLARMELYLFFTSLVKNFEIKLETDDTEPDLRGINGTVHQPKPFKVRMIQRQCK